MTALPLPPQFLHRPLTDEQRAEMFSPAANLRAALRYFSERYSKPHRCLGSVSPMTPEKLEQLRQIEAWRAAGGRTSAHYWINEEGEVEDMGTTIEAPSNPYRVVERDGMGWATIGDSPMVRVPARFDTERGPGLTGMDLHALAQSHHHAGYAKAEREYEAKLEEMRGQLATAFDEGYTAGRIQRAQGLARDVFTRLFEPGMALIEARGRVKTGTKAGDAAHEGFAEVEEALTGVREFVAGLFTPHDPDAAERAAAQVARDET